MVLAVILLGGGGGATYKLRFQNAGQLVKGDDVQVGGRRAGSIKSIELTNDNQALVTVEMTAFTPLHEGTTAVIRSTSLSGITNRYIALTLGPNSGPKIPDNGSINADKTTTEVDLDQLFNTLDPKTRKGLQQVVQGSAAQYQGKGAQANASAKYFAPTLVSTDKLVNELSSDQKALTDFIVNSSRLVTAVAARRNDLSSLVGNANATAGAIGDENVALAQALDLLPVTLRRANTTFVNLRSTLDDLTVLVDASKPATKKLAPFFRDLRPLVAAARPTIRDLSRLVRKAGPNNDAVELTRKFPKLQRLASPTFQHSIASLKRSTPVIQIIRPYTPDLVGWLRDFGQGASSYDANGHYARIQPIFNAFSLSGQILNPVPPSGRSLGISLANLRRCPGGASQKTADGSAPFVDSGANANPDCDPSVVPPGP